MLERKEDTRKKIQWGGLVKKAGLHEESSAVILGLLLEAMEKLEVGGESQRLDWKVKGDIAFSASQ